MRKYIGVKEIEAEPMSLNEFRDEAEGANEGEENHKDKPGYIVRYPDGYISWSPKGVFESAYMPLNDDGNLSEDVVKDFFCPKETFQGDEKTTLVGFEAKTGFKIWEASSCVNPEHYDEQVGIEMCTKRANGKMWELLGFVLQWARNGLK